MNHEESSLLEKSWLKRLGHLLVGDPQTQEDIIAILRETKESGILDSDAFTMVEGVLAVAEMQARDLMIPRSRMVVVEEQMPLTELLPILISSGHSRFPVIGEDKDDVIGILLAKDLLQYTVMHANEHFNIHRYLRPAVFVPESKRLNILLKEFRVSRNHIAIVVDEYGGVAGLITIEDILEEIVGDIADEHDVTAKEYHIKKQTDTQFAISALTPIDEFNEYFESDLDEEEFDTMGGLIMQGFGHLPRKGESLTIGNFRFTVLSADDRRIHLLKMIRLSGRAHTATSESEQE